MGPGLFSALSTECHYINRWHFLLLAVDTVVAIMTLSTNPLVTSRLKLDKEVTLVGSDTDKLKGELDEPLF